jgi:uncharacterized damage-inducible protein DinB
MDPGVRFAELLAYNSDENNHWKRWFVEHLAVLDLACDVAGAGTVRELVYHIFATELFFANLVQGLGRTNFEKVPPSTLDELFALTEEAKRKFEDFLAKSSEKDWAELKSLGFGTLKATPRKMLMQALWHSINHRGQLATFLRQQGHKPHWTHDILLSQVME